MHSDLLKFLPRSFVFFTSKCWKLRILEPGIENFACSPSVSNPFDRRLTIHHFAKMVYISKIPIFSVSGYTWIKKEMSRRYGEWKWVTGGLITQKLLFPISWAGYVSLLSWWTAAEASAKHWHYWGQGQQNQAGFQSSSLRSCSCCGPDLAISLHIFYSLLSGLGCAL